MAVAAAVGVVVLAAYALAPGLVSRLPPAAFAALGWAAAFLALYAAADPDLFEELFLPPRASRELAKSEEDDLESRRLFSRLLHEPLEQFKEDVRKGVGAPEEEVLEYTGTVVAMMEELQARREKRGEEGGGP